MRALRLLLALPLLLLAACAADPDAPDPYADRVAAEHEGETPTPTGLAAPVEAALATARPVYARLDDEDVTGYLARPDTAGNEAPAPVEAGVVVIHEWWGLNENVRMMTERLAAQGYVALAVDLYEGETAATSDAASSLMSTAMESPERLERNLQQAVAYLREEEGVERVGVIGWCFGGGWSLRAALAMPDALDATVIYYGQLVTDPDRLRRLDMPVLAIFGAEDSTIPPSDVEAFRTALDDLGIPAQVEVYEGADHAFANPSGERYAPEAANDAWEKTTAFLAEHLKDEA